MSDSYRLSTVVVHDPFAACARGLFRGRVRSGAVLNQIAQFAGEDSGQDVCIEDGSDFFRRGDDCFRHGEEYEKVRAWQVRIVTGNSRAVLRQPDGAPAVGEMDFLRPPVFQGSTVEPVADTTQQSQHGATAPESGAHEVVEAGLTSAWPTRCQVRWRKTLEIGQRG